MNQKNFEYLRDQVKFTGFGEGLEEELRKHMQQGVPAFELFHNATFGQDKTAAVLQFRRSDQGDMYFFNQYLLALRPENPSKIMEQTFYINKGNNITLKEAYNLMSGRAVNKDLTNKEGQVYNAWLQLDFKQTEANKNYKMKQFHQNYGFDLERTLARHPIRELENEQEKGRLLESLRKGNRQLVTFFQSNGSELRRFIEASPQYKSINVYDERMQRIRQGVKEQETTGQSVQKDHKREKQQQVPGSEEAGAASKRRAVRKGKSIGS
ncbi:MAG: hypothetical protein LPK07_13465 [Hymenobacteraceae bacterium]|nr:hypothetical protein [Hymenobacteraceae bacterium]